ncbi:MAG: hypothetical protein ABSD27_00485 [Bryobacteraceae bacterium]|jgi:hypothetical protein
MPGRLSLMLLLMSQATSPTGTQAPPAGAPRPETQRAFETYVRLTESRLDGLLQLQDGFYWANTPQRRSRLRQAGVVCAPQNGRGDIRVPRGLIHDWVGAAFIPGATVGQVLALLQDYDNHRNTYVPEVTDSRTLTRSGNDFKVRLRLLKRKVNVTAVLDADSEVHYRPLAGHDWQSRSHSTRIVEIENPGGPRERERTRREDHGYLWRLNSYWLFRERDGGVYVECEAVSLSRSVPAALAWLIDPIIRSLPRDELLSTLRTTRAVVLKSIAGGGPASGPRK